jgi:hypothetical protein
MFQLLQVVAILMVSGAMALALAHALEYPGKLRLNKDAYFATQQIYYPGFAIGGLAEGFSLVVLLLLTIVTPRGSAAYWLTLGAFVLMACMHAVYWVLIHPVNQFWVEGIELKGAGRGFFAFDPLGRTHGAAPEWTALRDRWEVSHIIRAILSVLALTLLAIAVVIE